MQIQNNPNLNSLSGVINEANKLLGEQKTQSTQDIKSIEKISQNSQEQDFYESTERNTYGMIALEIMNDEQYRAFERITAHMSVSEKIAVARDLTRAGNLSASVEKVSGISDTNTKNSANLDSIENTKNTQNAAKAEEDKPKLSAKEKELAAVRRSNILAANSSSADFEALSGVLGLKSTQWEEVAEQFQSNLNNLDNLYTKSFTRTISGNYNDIFRHNSEAKTQRILREFSHAIRTGGASVDLIG